VDNALEPATPFFFVGLVDLGYLSALGVGFEGCFVSGGSRRTRILCLRSRTGARVKLCLVLLANRCSLGSRIEARILQLRLGRDLSLGRLSGL
jgi:hypothetical protein